MTSYEVFGACLRSEIPLPELRRTHQRAPVARWTLRVGRASLPHADAELLGHDDVMHGVEVRLYRTSSGYRLTYDDTGTFEISRDGSEIVWFKGRNSWLGAVRLDILNRVLPVALHASGICCLHGSAVSVNGSAIAFLAPRGYGKSTLAIALTKLGGRVLTDDALALELGPPVMAWPGVHSVRLLDDAVRAVVGEGDSLRAVGAYPMRRRDLPLLPKDQPHITKQILGGLPEHTIMLDPVPLAAAYILTPVGPGATTIAERNSLPGVRAALSLVEHAKSGALLGKSESSVVFDRAVRVAQHVPVYRLEIARDLHRVGAVAEQLVEWHSSSPPAAVVNT